MLGEKEIESELKSLKSKIKTKSTAWKSAEERHAAATAKYEAQQNRLNEADVIIAHSDVVNYRAELYLLKQRQELLTSILENSREQSGPVSE